jgi:cytochrome c oxidase cbb3-type subunit 4
MISGIFTACAFAGFLGVTWWAYARHNRARFEEASQLPLTEDEPARSVAGNQEQKAGASRQ